MKTKTMYVADDGTSFDTEKECIDYEKSMNSYIILYKDKELCSPVKRTFDNESSAKRYIADLLHDCYKDNITGNFKLIYRGKTVEFNSNELARFVPAHHNIDGDKLNEVFQLSTTKEVKIPGYTLHGDYYLADEVIPNTTWKEACKMRKPVALPNGKVIIAHILSKKELETIPLKEKKCNKWYWTSTPFGDNLAWDVSIYGGFSYSSVDFSNDGGGARLGFKNPFTN